METEAKANGRYTLPPQFADAMALATHGSWDIFTLRATPHSLVERVRFIWHLNNLIQEKENADMERERRKAKRDN